MNVIDIVVGNLHTNCYLIVHEKELIIVDPGDESARIVEAIQETEAVPTLCLLTHAHFDHVLGLLDVIEKYKIPLFVHEKDVFLLKQSVDFGKIEKYVQYIDEKSEVVLGSLKFQVLETPGHTPGSISLYCERESTIFVGDLLFSGGFVGRTDFEYGNEAVLIDSIGRVLQLPSNTKAYSGHGASFSISDWRL